MTERSNETSADSQVGATQSGFLVAARERAQCLLHSGYNECDAGFLVAATMTGGYFLRRQHREWSGDKWGCRSARMLKRAVALGHVRACASKSLYRVCCNWLYREAGVACRRYGRPGIKRRLLVLDFLTTRGDEPGWMVGADAKTAYFRGLGIDEDRLRVGHGLRRGKARLLDDALPIRAAQPGLPVVELVYAHIGATTHAMELYLRQYEALVARLRVAGIGCRWWLLSEDPLQFPCLRRTWGTWVRRIERDSAEVEYFALRKPFEAQQWASLSVADIDRYAELDRVHRNEGADRRYRRWLEGAWAPQVVGADFGAACDLSEVPMEGDYSAVDWVG